MRNSIRLILDLYAKRVSAIYVNPSFLYQLTNGYPHRIRESNLNVNLILQNLSSLFHQFLMHCNFLANWLSNTFAFSRQTEIAGFIFLLYGYWRPAFKGSNYSSLLRKVCFECLLLWDFQNDEGLKGRGMMADWGEIRVTVIDVTVTVVTFNRENR